MKWWLWVVVAACMVFVTVHAALAQSVGLDLSATQSTLWNDAHTYVYDEPCSQYLRNPPQAQANVSYGAGVWSAGVFTTLFPTPTQCRRLNGTNNVTYAYVAANFSLVNANIALEVTKNGSLSDTSPNITERLSVRLNKTFATVPFLLVRHSDIDIARDGVFREWATFQFANGSTGGNCSQQVTSTRRGINLTCVDTPIFLNGSQNLSNRVLAIMGDGGPAIYFEPDNLTTEWGYAIYPGRRVFFALKAPSRNVGTRFTATWSWVDACLVGVNCGFVGWTASSAGLNQMNGGTLYGVPNMSNTTNASASYSCTDPFATPEVNDCRANTGCRITFQRSTVGAVGTIATTTQGTATDPLDCGGLACAQVINQKNVNDTNTTTCTFNGSINGTTGVYIPGTLQMRLRVYRANATGSSVLVRATTDFPGSSAAGWAKFYVQAAGGPNVTQNLTWRDGTNVLNNGTNQSSRLLGNRTIFWAYPVSDGALVNVSLWGNFSVNGSNSSAFRLVQTNNSCTANATCTLAVNITDAGNYSWMVCAQNNASATYGTENTTELGFGCTRSWVRNASKYTANQTSQGERTVWFNASFPVASAVAANTRPWVVLVAPANGSALNTNWTALSWTVTDNESGTLRCNLTFNGSLFGGNNSYAVLNASTFSVNVSGLDDDNATVNDSNTSATYSWSVYCCDGGGLCDDSGISFFSTLTEWMIAVVLIVGLIPLGIVGVVRGWRHRRRP